VRSRRTSSQPSKEPPAQTHYNQLAGQSTERLAAISDGIFAVAMTLLVLTLVVPAAGSYKTESDLLGWLGQLAPSLVTYTMSFLTAGIFWVGQQTQISQIERTDRNLTWIHLAFLFAVTLLPFSTQLLAHFIQLRVALIVYWFNIFLLGSALLAAAEYALHKRYFTGEEAVQRHTVHLLRKRIYVAQGLYGAATALCLVSTSLSIALIVLVQLNYIVAPQIPLLRRL
jgi:uncharacterized membrane protein